MIYGNDIIIGEDVHPPVVPLVKHTILKSSGFGGWRENINLSDIYFSANNYSLIFHQYCLQRHSSQLNSLLLAFEDCLSPEPKVQKYILKSFVRKFSENIEIVASC